MTTFASPPQPGAEHSGGGEPTALARLQAWLLGLPVWMTAGGTLVLLVAISAVIRTLYIGGQFWIDEGITTGIATHAASAIPGILREDGNPPVYYLLLHYWIRMFGDGVSATHALSVIFGLLTIPAGMWAGWSLFGRRTGIYAAVLLAFGTFLTQYGQETRMYELMALLGTIVTASFLHGFVFRRRRYVVLFSLTLAVMLYTQSWATFYTVGAAIALIPVYLASEDRRGLLRDAVFAFVGAGVLFLPWLPTLLFQTGHTAAPWSSVPSPAAPFTLVLSVLGSDGIAVALFAGAAIGLAPLFTAKARGSRERTLVLALVILPVATVLVAWIGSQVTPAFVPRYYAPLLAPTMLIAAWGAARAGFVGVIAIVLSVVFVAQLPGFGAPKYKSDMRDISGEMTPLLHRGDTVIVGQPESMPLAWYYLGSELHYVSTIGPVRDPRYMNWVNSVDRLRSASPAAVLGPLLARLKPGQQVLFVRPLTEGAYNWQAPWTSLVRRRSAQWGTMLAGDPHLKEVAWAPHDYQGACCVADSAVLYREVS
jgi:mannosyltransferase